MIRLVTTLEFPRQPATVPAWRFPLLERSTGAAAGVAVVCLEARYASVAWCGAPRLVRLHLTPDQWRAIEGEGAASAALAGVLRGERGTAVEVGPVEMVTVEAVPAQLAAALDAQTQRSL